MICPICQAPNISAAHILGHSKSEAKAKASARNGKKGGRPKLTAKARWAKHKKERKGK